MLFNYTWFKEISFKRNERITEKLFCRQEMDHLFKGHVEDRTGPHETISLILKAVYVRITKIVFKIQVI